jgi:hypothetical protein
VIYCQKEGRKEGRKGGKKEGRKRKKNFYMFPPANFVI